MLVQAYSSPLKVKRENRKYLMESIRKDDVYICYIFATFVALCAKRATTFPDNVELRAVSPRRLKSFLHKSRQELIIEMRNPNVT